MKDDLLRAVDTNGDLFIEMSGGRINGRFQISTSTRWTHWAIRNDNLKLVEIFASAAMAIATYAVKADASPLIPAAALLIAVAVAVDKVRKKKADLTYDQVIVLIALKALKTCTAEELARELGGLHLFGNDLWDTAKTLAALEELRAVRLGDGSLESLVTQTNDGLWSVNGV